MNDWHEWTTWSISLFVVWAIVLLIAWKFDGGKRFSVFLLVFSGYILGYQQQSNLYF